MLTEDEITWRLYNDKKATGSTLFFKIKHNVSTSRDWSYYCAPDVDLMEVKPDNTIVGYEIKGQRKSRNGEPSWPALYDGLGQALAYLQLPSVFSSSGKSPIFSGGAFDHVYLVTARPNNETRENTAVLELTPIGYMTICPNGSANEIVSPKNNPLKSDAAKEHLLQNLDTLKGFSESSRTFRNLTAKFDVKE